MVRLLLENHPDDQLCELGFNPTMVRLLQTVPAEEVTEEEGFNPTMVRLLPIRETLNA